MTQPQAEPTILIIFGITGDLAKRYLLPSLYHLVEQDLLHEKTEIIGVTRGDLSIDELLSTVELCVNKVDGICDPVMVNKLKARLHIRHMDVTDPTAYDTLLTDLNQLEDQHGVHMNRLYYLSIPPTTAQPIIRMLGEHGHNQSCQHGAASTRLLVEKPFGFDYESARQLIGPAIVGVSRRARPVGDGVADGDNRTRRWRGRPLWACCQSMTR